MKIKTREVFLVLHKETNEVEVVLERADQFRKWIVYYNVERIRSKMTPEFEEYKDTIETIYRKGGESYELRMFCALGGLRLSEEVAVRLLDFIEYATESPFQFRILKRSLLTAIKL